MKPRHPIYIPTLSRWRRKEDAKRPSLAADTKRVGIQMTSRALSKFGVPHHLIVEERQADEYRKRLYPHATLLVLDPEYQRSYDAFDDLPRQVNGRHGEDDGAIVPDKETRRPVCQSCGQVVRSVGPGAARNFAWDHALANGAEWHWVMDDNIQQFYRLNYNLKTPVADGTILRAMEAFAERYENLAMAGPQYFMFAPPLTVDRPIILNTRIYSCNLIRNDLPYRWRGRYNEDTDISLRMLKDGWCTVQFYAFLQNKMTTQLTPGGNNETFYALEGTKAKSQMQVDMHPDVSRLTWKFGRWHHEVDYSPFRQNKLRLRPGVTVPKGVDNFGMKLQRRVGGKWFDADRPFAEVDVGELRASPSRLVKQPILVEADANHADTLFPELTK